MGRVTKPAVFSGVAVGGVIAVLISLGAWRTIEIDGAAASDVIGARIVADVDVSPAQLEPGDLAQVTVDLRTGEERSPADDLSVRLELGPHLRVLFHPAGDWACDPAVTGPSDTVMTCSLPSRSFSSVGRESARFIIAASEGVHGLRGISAIAWFGEATPDRREWSRTQEGTEADSTMVSIGVPNRTRPATTAVRSTRVMDLSTTSDLGPFPAAGARRQVTSATMPSAPSSRTPVASAADPPPEFCDLFDAVSASGAAAAGLVTFSDLGEATTNGGSCSSTSIVTLSSTTVAFGDVEFEDVVGTATPASLTFSASVDDEVTLEVSGPFPGAGTAFAATVGFSVGSSSVTLQGDVDYSSSSSFSITLSASATSIGWRPLPGLSMDSGGVTGTFTRTTGGAGVIDTFDAAISFGGTWSPFPGLTVETVAADVSNTSGDLVITLGATLSGDVDLAGLRIDADAALTGTIDVDTEVLTVTGDIDPFTVADVLTLGPAEANFRWDPRADGAGSTQGPITATLTGTAAFTGVLAEFFDGSVSATITLTEDGFVVEASMTTAPSTPGYTLSGPKLLWASLSDPSTTVTYSPAGSSLPPVPLGHQAGVAVAPFGVPPALSGALSDLGIDLLDDVGTGTVALTLPPDDLSVSIHYFAPPNAYLIGNKRSSVSLLFDDIFVAVSSGEEESFTIGGDVTLNLSGEVLQLSSALVVAIGALGASVDGYLELRDTSGWPNAFGLSGVTLYDLVVEAGMADGLPSFGVEASVSFPSSLTTPLGIVPGSVVTLGIDVSATSPCFLFDIEAPAGRQGQNVLDLGSGTLTATSARMVIAPDGCQLGTNQYSGFALEFAGAIRGVEVGFSTQFTLDPDFSLTGSAYVGSFPVGGLTFDETTVNLSITDSAFSLRIDGGITAGSSLTAKGELYLESGGGYSFAGNGTVKIGGDDFDVDVKATNCANSSCSSLMPPVFWASGDVLLKGFGFSASIEIDTDGVFDAKLVIPSRTVDFRFSSGSLKGSGKLTYSFSVEVSDTGSDEIKAATSASLSSCQWTFISCKGAKASASADVKTGSAQVTVSITYVVTAKVGINVK